MNKIIFSIAIVAMTLTSTAQAVDWEAYKQKAAEYDRTLEQRLGFNPKQDNSKPIVVQTRDSTSDGLGHVLVGKIIDVCDQPGAVDKYPHCKIANNDAATTCTDLGGVWANGKCDLGGGYSGLGWKNTNWIPVEFVVKSTETPGTHGIDTLIRYAFHVNADDKKAYVKDLYFKGVYTRDNQLAYEVSYPQNNVVDITDSLGANFLINTAVFNVFGHDNFNVHVSPSRTYATFGVDVFRSGTDAEQGAPQFDYRVNFSTGYSYY